MVSSDPPQRLKRVCLWDMTCLQVLELRSSLSSDLSLFLSWPATNPTPATVCPHCHKKPHHLQTHRFPTPILPVPGSPSLSALDPLGHHLSVPFPPATTYVWESPALTSILHKKQDGTLVNSRAKLPGFESCNILLLAV